ncbi:MAG: 16S rRNA (guanine(527)-N(7))-methyltransferase RsmG [Rhodobacter sp.]|nr:16S rRNA (guanine(527)-N(7))-methyltransferase RsmG [Rhodobacter sp.]
MMAVPPANEITSNLNVSRETLDRLQVFSDLIRKWNQTINLIASSTLDQIWSRHIADSAAVFHAARVTDGSWVDLGAGAGLPGAVVAILANELAPALSVNCIESDVRKAAFIRTVARETGVPIGVITRRIEDAPPQFADIVSARALAPLPKLLEYCERHLKPGGRGVFPKGEAWQSEVSKALESWRFTVETQPSRTHPGSAVLIVGDVERA